eukprot:3697579-Heterocapsa_arctica.AAC.1
MPPPRGADRRQSRRIRIACAELALVLARLVGSGPNAQILTARLVGLGPVTPASRARDLAHDDGVSPTEDSELDSSEVASSTGSSTSITDTFPLGCSPRTFFAQQSLQ